MVAGHRSQTFESGGVDASRECRWGGDANLTRGGTDDQWQRWTHRTSLGGVTLWRRDEGRRL